MTRFISGVGAKKTLPHGVPSYDALILNYFHSLSRYGGIEKAPSYPVPSLHVYEAFVLWRASLIIHGIIGRHRRGLSSSLVADRFSDDDVRYFNHCAEERALLHQATGSCASSSLSPSLIEVPNMSVRGKAMLERVKEFMTKYVYPNEELYESQLKEFEDSPKGEELSSMSQSPN
jgi:hypothetical protein